MSHILPLKTDYVFTEAKGQLGVLWRELCDIENQLASKLHDLPPGTGAVGINGENTWVLRDAGDQLVLVHINCRSDDFCAAAVEYSDSRFDFDLDWVDVGEPELETYIGLVAGALASFQTRVVPGFPAPEPAPAPSAQPRKMSPR